MSATPGLPVRRAALRLLDAVFRRGETLEQAGRDMATMNAAIMVYNTNELGDAPPTGWKRPPTCWSTPLCR
mgnify:CR=1 FL=1